ncbi:transmembrane protein 116-like [Xenia sp. Carnegie-2017]|uniref:transmembrane protein 116-like n=1 Tax=Xenia sp. Carnegie-2017 TaxID=2897299 RepID=UPI001F047C92|nr:transmembrane protein 116-like [Xenia sp. Carnegie-2017]
MANGSKDYSNGSIIFPSDLNPVICEQPRNYSPDMLKYVAFIYMVTSLLSVVGSSSIILFALKKKIVSNHEIQPLFNLSLADFFLGFGWFLATCLWWVHPDGPSISTETCFYIEMFTQIFQITSFFLTVNYAVHVFIRVQQRAVESGTRGFYYRKRGLFRGLYMFSWITPLLVMLPMIIYHSSHNFVHCSRCLVLIDQPKARVYNETRVDVKNFAWRNYASIVLLLTICFAITVMLVLYFVALRKLAGTMKRYSLLSVQQRQRAESNRKRVLLYIAVFFVCWLPALVVVLVKLATEEKYYDFKKMFVVFLIEAIFTPLQGFLNSLVYGWTRSSFRHFNESTSSYRRPLLPPDRFTTSIYGTSSPLAH